MGGVKRGSEIREHVAGGLEEEAGGGIGEFFVDGGGVNLADGFLQGASALFGQYLDHARGQMLFQILEFLGRYVGVGHIFVSFAMARSVPK